MAAKSLSGRIMAFQPMRIGSAADAKWIFSTTQSVFRTSDVFRPGDSTTAQSSPVAAITLRETGSPRSNDARRSEEHTSELQSHLNLVCRLLLEKKKTDDHVLSESNGPPV